MSGGNSPYSLNFTITCKKSLRKQITIEIPPKCQNKFPSAKAIMFFDRGRDWLVTDYVKTF